MIVLRERSVMKAGLGIPDGQRKRQGVQMSDRDPIDPRVDVGPVHLKVSDLERFLANVEPQCGDGFHRGAPLDGGFQCA